METVVDLFCGAGLFSRAARRAGLVPVGAVDWDADACASYAANHPVAPVCADARDIDFRAWRGVDMVIGSPPCTRFSPAAARGRTGDDQLALQFARAVREIEPRAFVLENVVGLRRFSVFQSLLSALRSYYISAFVLNSADFGVPQRRVRLFVAGSRDGFPALAPPRAAHVPVRAILTDAPCRSRLSDLAIARLLRNIIEREYIASYYSSSSRVWQSLDRPLRTVTTISRHLLVKDGYARMLNETEHRRAMDIPEQYVLCGSLRSRMRQIGNAVVPAVARAVINAACASDHAAVGMF